MKKYIYYTKDYISKHTTFYLSGFAFIVSSISTSYFYMLGLILAYGDAESHLNIAKRVTGSLTPGLAQLGGIWLPLPHLLMVPFVYNNILWRTGLGGSIVSGIACIISAVFLYKTSYVFFQNKIAALSSYAIFLLNPNILYLQTTPMTELTLLMFSILSIYFFSKFITNDEDIVSLIFSGFFGFCATLSRYDGWFLVFFEAGVIIVRYIFIAEKRKMMEGKVIIFSTVAFFGIALWFLWNFLILGDPLYFVNSPFSSHAQQMTFLARGQLPAYHNFFLSFFYYFFDSVDNIGIIISIISLIGAFMYIQDETYKEKFLVFFILIAPFVFNVVSLFMGQSIIFIPELTPKNYPWNYFNVRYGIMMIPFAAIFIAYLMSKLNFTGKLFLTNLFLLQLVFYTSGFNKVITVVDGVDGLSAVRHEDSDYWMASHYDHGMVLMDDFNRSVDLIMSNISIHNEIYIGTKPYWDESLVTPEKYATWVVMKKNDAVWQTIYNNPITRGRLYKYFVKVYTSPNTLIFRRNETRY